MEQPVQLGKISDGMDHERRPIPPRERRTIELDTVELLISSSGIVVSDEFYFSGSLGSTRYVVRQGDFTERSDSGEELLFCCRYRHVQVCSGARQREREEEGETERGQRNISKLV